MICHDSSEANHAKEIDDLLCQNDICTYCTFDGDVNHVIADGVENAGCIIILPSANFQDSSLCMKAVCYGDQCKIPFLCIDTNMNSWTPSSWLGAILAVVPKCSIESIIDGISTCCDGLTSVQGREQVRSAATNAATRRPSVSKDIFPGGAVQGYFYDPHAGDNFEMKFDFFKIANDHIVGQGGDAVGPFTVRGNYECDGGQYNASFIKQYIGQHQVVYSGVLKQNDFGGFVITGSHNYGGKFEVSGGDVPHDLIQGTKDVDDSVGSMHWTIVLIGSIKDVDITKVLRESLTSQGVSDDANIRSVAVIRPSDEINSMLRACLKADVIVPIMSPALEEDDVAMRVLTWCEKSKKSIVPAKINTGGYTQKGKSTITFQDTSTLHELILIIIVIIHCCTRLAGRFDRRSSMV